MEVVQALKTVPFILRTDVLKHIFIKRSKHSPRKKLIFVGFSQGTPNPGNNAISISKRLHELGWKVLSLGCFRKVHIYVKVVWIVRIRGHFIAGHQKPITNYSADIYACASQMCIQVRFMPGLLHVKIFDTLNSIFFFSCKISSQKN